MREIDGYPERFSPNALLRPLYQEVVLPNLCYIGGGGELAYWLQLKSLFDAVQVPFPMVLLRNSAVIKTSKQQSKLDKLKVALEDLFLKQDELVEKHLRKRSEIAIDFTKQKEHLKDQFEELYSVAEKTDRSFLGAVGAQERKQIKGLEHLEKRLLKAQKRRMKDETDRVRVIQNELFPNQSLQERQANFSEFFLLYGPELKKNLFNELDPLAQRFAVLEF